MSILHVTPKSVFWALKLIFKIEIQHATTATYDTMFMVDMACDFFRRHFGWKVFVICLLYKTFKGKLKIQGHLGIGFTTTCIMIVYENVMKSGTN